MFFFVPGNPIALKRHRQGRWGNYDPSAGDKSDFLAKAMQFRPEVPFDVPIFVTLNFNFSRPKNHYGTGKNSNKLKDSSPFWHTSTPDLDNLEKFVFDALNGVFWKDDKICAKKESGKQYVDTTPGIYIKIEPL